MLSPEGSTVTFRRAAGQRQVTHAAPSAVTFRRAAGQRQVTHAPPSAVTFRRAAGPRQVTHATPSTVTFRRAAPDVRARAIERFARKLQREVAQGQAFDTLISGDAELRRLNREFRGRDYATDVLSFPCAGQAGRPVLLGDLAISLPRARAQAREFGHSAEQEVRILMLHGLLHLLGMDHASDGGRMARAEKRWRVKLGLERGLIERAPS